MKVFKITITILLTFILINQSFAQQKPVEVDGGFKIEIQTSAICEMCKEALEYDLTFEKGVKSAELNLEDKVMSIVYNPKKTDADILRKRISLVGYNADNIKRDSTAYENLPFCCKDGGHDNDH